MTVQIFGRLPGASEALVRILLSPVVLALAVSLASLTAVLLLLSGTHVPVRLANAALAGLGAAVVDILQLPRPRPSFIPLRLFVATSVITGLLGLAGYLTLSGSDGPLRDSFGAVVLVALITPSVVVGLVKSLPSPASPDAD